MISLKNILKEYNIGQYSPIKNIDLSDIMSLIKSDHLQSYNLYKNYKRLFRGMSIHRRPDPFYYIDPTESERTSKNTDNLYVALLDTLPSWKNFPKRSRSIIFTTNFGTASGYGNVFIVLLKNNAKIACASTEDLWKGFPYLIKETRTTDLDDFLMKLSKLLQSLKNLYNIDTPDLFKGEDITMNNINEFYDKMKNITLDVLKRYISDSNMDSNNLEKSMIKWIENNSKSEWMYWFNDIFNPIKNNIQLTTLNKIPYDYSIECWSDSPAILIVREEMEKINDIT